MWYLRRREKRSKEYKQVIAKGSSKSTTIAISESCYKGSRDTVAIKGGAYTEGWRSKVTSVVRHHTTDYDVYTINRYIPISITRSYQGRQQVGFFICLTVGMHASFTSSYVDFCHRAAMT